MGKGWVRLGQISVQFDDFDSKNTDPASTHKLPGIPKKGWKNHS